MPKQYRIGIVGFGVAGATASFLLARAGHVVTLFERAPEVGPVGAGILLQPSGQQVLRDLGLLDKVARLGEPIEEIHAVTHRGGTLVRLPYSDIGKEGKAYGLHRGDLFGALHEAVLAHDVQVQLGREIHAYRNSKRQVLLADISCREHGPFDFILAADGSRSALRRASKIPKLVHEYAYGVMWAMGRCSAFKNKLHQVVRGTQELIGLLPMGQGRCSLFYSLRRDKKEGVWQRGIESWKAKVLKLCPLAEEVLAEIVSFKQVAFTTYLHVWMRSWFDNHVLFLGDAAHAMSPHLGQGINLALIDAQCFCNCLASSRNYHEAFRRYTWSRQRQIGFYSMITLLLTPFFQSGGWIKGLGRDACLPLMPRVGWLRRQMVITMAGMKTGYF